MPFTSTNFKVTFDTTADPKVFIFEDITDYAAQGVDPNNIVGLIKVTAPDGDVPYNNTDFDNPDIDMSISEFNSTTITIPVLVDDEVEPGLFQFLYTSRDTSDNTTVTKTVTYDYCYEAPEVELSITSDCILPLFVSTDTTVYTFDGIVPTITRTHTLYYPPVIGGTYVAASATLQTNVFYTETQSVKLVADLVYAINDNVVIHAEVTGTDEHKVECDATLCDLYCCILSVYRQYKDYSQTNKILADNYLAKFLKIQSIRSLIKDSLDCNKGENVDELVADILRIGGCEAGCGCSDDSPVPVVGLSPFTPGEGGSATSVVEVAGAPLSVSSAVVGDVTTYTVTFDPTVYARINALFNTTLTAGTAITLTPTVQPNGDTDYVVDAVIPDAPSVLSFKVTFSFTALSMPTFVMSDLGIYGDYFRDFSGDILPFLVPKTNSISANLGYELRNVAANGTNDAYKAFIQVKGSAKTPRSAAPDPQPAQLPRNPVNIHQAEFQDNDTLDFYFVDNAGNNMSPQNINLVAQTVTVSFLLIK